MHIDSGHWWKNGGGGDRKEDDIPPFFTIHNFNDPLIFSYFDHYFYTQSCLALLNAFYFTFIAYLEM